MLARRTYLSLRMAFASLTVLTFALAVRVQAQTLTTLAFFNGTNGSVPLAPVEQGVDGNFYGTTQSGGNNFGVIFKITPGGTLTTLHIFHGPDGTDPTSIIQGTDGNLYGTTGGGTGAASKGTIFKITLAGALTTIARFNGMNGWLPNGLIEGVDGNFYGTTLLGGTPYCNFRCGVIFKVTPQGILSTLHNFYGVDGSEPFEAPVQGSDGNFYGTTSGIPRTFLGTIYKITPQGAFTVLYNFTNSVGTATSGLAQGSDGNFYGSTIAGGENEQGILFKIAADGTFTTLLSLTDIVFDPSTLTRATDGNLYGSALESFGDGSLFSVTEGGDLSVLHSFNGVDGATPMAALIQGTDGKFYGTTSEGGAGIPDQGSVFSFSMGLAPFAEILNTSGKIGAPVIILGNDLTGTSSVTFNGVGAAFTVVSASEIKATVPNGATSGTVQVTTPDGTLNSNVPFLVTP